MGLFSKSEAKVEEGKLSKQKDDLIEKMMITTTDNIPGVEIIECKGLVEHSSLLKTIINESFLKDFKTKAFNQGANAIVGLRYTQPRAAATGGTFIGTGVVIDPSLYKVNTPVK